MQSRELVELLSNNCQFDLTAERLRLQQNELVSSILASRDDSVNESLRYLLAFRTYDLLMQVRLVLAASLDQMSPTELAKLYKDLMTTFNSLSTPASRTDEVPDDDLEDDSDDAVKSRLMARIDELAERRDKLALDEEGRTAGEL